MANRKRIGAFIFKVESGYPVWIEVSLPHGGTMRFMRFTHKDIRDLKRVCQDIEKEARKELGSRQNEI